MTNDRSSTARDPAIDDDSGLNLSLNSDQHLLRDSFARLFDKESTMARVREAGPLGFDPRLWGALVESGAPLARVPTDNGGLDLSLLDAAIIAEEAGRTLASAPLVEAMVAARLLAMSGHDVASTWIEQIAGGAIVVLSLRPAIAGQARNVLGGAIADAVLVMHDDELVLISGRQKTHADSNVGHLPVANWPVDPSNEGATRIVLANGDKAARLIEAAIVEWRVLTAATLGGLARRALALASDYARERIQFGRPIGSFQGLAHPLADSVTDVDGGQMFVRKSIWAIATGQTNAACAVTLAWWWMGQATVVAVRRAMRTLGGYGLSLEYDLQLFNRRGNALVLHGGDPQEMLDEAGELLFGGADCALPDAGAVGISFGFGALADAHATATADFFRENWTDQLAAKAHHSSASHDREFHRKLAHAGFIFGDWPVEHGGRGATTAEEFASGNLFEKWNYTTHVIATTNLVAQIVMRYGSDAAKAEILPRVKAGDAVCSLGFSEPAAGSDVFAAKTAAVRDGEDWIINGQKMFTTAGHYADYVMVLARTSNDGSKHAGLTLFCVPTSLPGYEFHPVQTYQDERTNITYYADMRVPDVYRLGPVDGGAGVMSAALALEHGGESYFRALMRLLDKTGEWAATPDLAGKRPLDRPDVRQRLAKIRARFEVGSCFVARGVWGTDTNQFDRAWGPMAKMFISEATLQSAWDVLEMGGPEANLTGSHPLGFVELDHRRAYGMTIYGGTNEIHRSLIAEQALGLPKSRS